MANLTEMFKKVLWTNVTSESLVKFFKEGEQIDENYSCPQEGFWGLTPKPRNPKEYARVFLGKTEKEADAFLSKHYNSMELAIYYGNNLDNKSLKSTGWEL